jgi:hypothetical protein
MWAFWTADWKFFVDSVFGAEGIGHFGECAEEKPGVDEGDSLRVRWEATGFRAP